MLKAVTGAIFLVGAVVGIVAVVGPKSDPSDKLNRIDEAFTIAQPGVQTDEPCFGPEGRADGDPSLTVAKVKSSGSTRFSDDFVQCDLASNTDASFNLEMTDAARNAAITRIDGLFAIEAVDKPANVTFTIRSDDRVLCKVTVTGIRPVQNCKHLASDARLANRSLVVSVHVKDHKKGEELFVGIAQGRIKTRETNVLQRLRDHLGI